MLYKGLCAASLFREKPSILYFYLKTRISVLEERGGMGKIYSSIKNNKLYIYIISVLWPLCIESKANPTARHYNCFVNLHLFTNNS